MMASLIEHGIRSPAVLHAMAGVPREEFVLEEDRARAYADRALPIDAPGQTISQPLMVAAVVEALELHAGDSALDVGTGSGYQAAVLAALVRQVYSAEVIPALSAQAATALTREGVGNVALRLGDGAVGWPEFAPYDGIIVTAAGPEVPPALVAQLGPGGRMVIPIGEPFGDQMLVVVSKTASGGVSHRDILPVAFVPLVGG